MSNGKNEQDSRVAISASEKEFLIEEYKALRSEVELLYDLSERIERNALTLIAVMYGFYFGNVSFSSSPVSSPFLFAPPLVALFLIWRKYIYADAMSRVGVYISEKIEKRFLSEEGGWETFLVSRRPKPRWIFFRSLFWLALFLGGFIFALYQVFWVS